MPFMPGLYTATKHTYAADKKKIAEHLAAFIDSGFSVALFTHALYKALNSMFGHIAHYNREGFYNTWFESTRMQAKWLHNAANWSCPGDPAFTWSDVERDIQSYIKEHKLCDIWDTRVAAAIEAGERAELARLKAKYEGGA